MKKVLLLFIIICSKFGYTQTISKPSFVKQMEEKILEDVVGNPAKIKHTSNPEKTLIAKYDSIDYWTWSGSCWDKYAVLMSFTYDSDNLLTSTIKKTFDGTSFINDEKNTSTYDVNGDKINSTYQLWNGSAWFSSIVGDYTFNSNHDMLTYVYTNWDGSSMVNLSKGTYIYDVDSNLTSYTTETWDGASWVRSYRTLSTYDQFHHLLEEIFQSWDGAYWVNGSRKTYVYNSTGYLLNLLDEEWDGAYWVKLFKDDYSYDAYNNLKDDYYYLWNVDSAQWYNSSHINNIYNVPSGHKISTSVVSDWNGSSWNYTSKDIFSYNANNIQINLTQQLYLNNNWEAKLIADYTFDGNSFKQSDRVMNYSGGAITSGDSIYYYFHTQVDNSGIKELSKKEIDISAYPNPATNKITIESEEAIKSLQLTTLNGQEVYNKLITDNSTKHIIDLSDFNKGIYFIRIETNQYKDILKVVVQ